MNKQRAALISIVSNSFLVATKLAGGILMGSVSVISESIHSGIDLLASLVAYVSIKASDKPADSDHPYGHGKFENISGFFEAILIFVAAGIIIVEAVKKVLHPGVVERLDWGIAIMAASVIVNSFVSIALLRIAKREKSIALEADGMHLSVDVFTSLGVLAGLFVMRITKLTILDPMIAFAVAALILKTSWDLTKKSLEDLADKALPEGEIKTITEILSHFPEIRHFHKLRTRKAGNKRELDIHIHVDGSTAVGKAHDLCNEIETAIKKNLPDSYIVIHVEPCNSCR